MRVLRNLTLASLCAVVLARAQAPASGKIVQINLADIVHPVSAAYVKDGLNHAKDISARAVILRLDTPGGLGKVPVGPNYVVSRAPGVTRFRTHRGVEVDYFDPPE